jgi:hypothetical protein
MARFGRMFDDTSVVAFDTLDVSDIPIAGSNASQVVDKWLATAVVATSNNGMVVRATTARSFRCYRPRASTSRNSGAQSSSIAARQSASIKR